MPKIISSIILLSILLFPAIALGQEKKEISSPIESMWFWVKEKIIFIYDKIYFVLSQEVEERKPGTEQEFKKETEELKQELEEKGPSLWRRLMDLIDRSGGAY